MAASVSSSLFLSPVFFASDSNLATRSFNAWISALLIWDGATGATGFAAVAAPSFAAAVTAANNSLAFCRASAVVVLMLGVSAVSSVKVSFTCAVSSDACVPANACVPAGACSASSDAVPNASIAAPTAVNAASTDAASVAAVAASVAAVMFAFKSSGIASAAASASTVGFANSSVTFVTAAVTAVFFSPLVKSALKSVKAVCNASNSGLIADFPPPFIAASENPATPFNAAKLFPKTFNLILTCGLFFISVCMSSGAPPPCSATAGTATTGTAVSPTGPAAGAFSLDNFFTASSMFFISAWISSLCSISLESIAVASA